MNVILLVAAATVLALIILAKIPGLEHMVRPLIDWLFKFLTWLIENSFAWSIFMFKAMWFSHIEIARNLILSADAIDPTVGMREQQASAPTSSN